MERIPKNSWSFLGLGFANYGTNPSGDAGADPALSIWQIIFDIIGEAENQKILT